MNSPLSGFFLGYLLERLVVRIFDFARHWYIDGSLWFWRAAKTMVGNLDQTLALRATFYHIQEPLYGDYTISGRVIGFIFRILRILLGIVLYVVIGVLSLAFYIIWIALPLYLLAQVFI